MKTYFYSMLSASFMALSFISCSNDEPENPSTIGMEDTITRSFCNTGVNFIISLDEKPSDPVNYNGFEFYDFNIFHSFKNGIDTPDIFKYAIYAYNDNGEEEYHIYSTNNSAPKAEINIADRTISLHIDTDETLNYKIFFFLHEYSEIPYYTVDFEHNSIIADVNNYHYSDINEASGCWAGQVTIDKYNEDSNVKVLLHKPTTLLSASANFNNSAFNDENLRPTLLGYGGQTITNNVSIGHQTQKNSLSTVTYLPYRWNFITNKVDFTEVDWRFRLFDDDYIGFKHISIFKNLDGIIKDENLYSPAFVGRIISAINVFTPSRLDFELANKNMIDNNGPKLVYIPLHNPNSYTQRVNEWYDKYCIVDFTDNALPGEVNLYFNDFKSSYMVSKNISKNTKTSLKLQEIVK